MSDTFLLAARVPMSREGFDRWLDTPAPGHAAIANPAAMFDGRYWDGQSVDGLWDAAGATPREFFGGLVEQACDGGPQSTVLLHRDGALEAYLLRFGFAEDHVRTALLMFAGTGPVMAGPGDGTVLFWAETGANMLAADDDGWLSVLSIGAAGSRFVASADLAAPVAALRPVENLLFALIERLGDEEDEWDADAGPYRTETPRDPAFVDPAVLTQKS